jgi:hypothetical protein
MKGIKLTHQGTGCFFPNFKEVQEGQVGGGQPVGQTFRGCGAGGKEWGVATAAWRNQGAAESGGYADANQAGRDVIRAVCWGEADA